MLTSIFQFFYFIKLFLCFKVITKTEKYLQNILNKNYNSHYNMDRALSFDYESNKIIRIWGYEKEVDQLSTSFLPIFDKFFSTLRKL